MKERKDILISCPAFGVEEWEALRGPIRDGWVTQGPKVAEFEKEFAELHQVKYAVATTSCTTALHLALAALGIGSGDEVVVPAFTWISTANAVEYVGAKPVFCDVDRKTFNIDPKQMERAITPRTRAIIPVHLFGLCADMKSIMDLCRGNDIHIVEDAACAAGASFKDKMAGSLGDIGCFSFHPRKIITTGEGGMCTTNNKLLADKIVCLRNHGASISEEERHKGAKAFRLPDFDRLGFNYRMTDLQGAIGIVQLGKISALIKDRRNRAQWYKDKLKALDWLETPWTPPDCAHVYQAFVCYIDGRTAPVTRDQLMEKLYDCKINTRPGTHAVHMQNYYAVKYGFRPEDFPVARDCAEYSIALPLHSRMSDEDYEYVVGCLMEFV